MKVTILGNNSALPAYGRHPTAQILEIAQFLMLIDCGEGTQIRLQQFGFSSLRISHIFISHAHGDHYFGLVGLISSMALSGRTKKLFVCCPPLVQSALKLQISWDLGFEIEYRVLSERETNVIWATEKCEVRCFPVVHSIPTHGFLFTEKQRKRVLLPEKVAQYEIPKYYYKKLTEGHDYRDRHGNIFLNEELTLPGKAEKRYAYTADTAYDENLCQYFPHVDLLYHESTYLHENLEKAQKRLHSTARQAGLIAHKAVAKRLIIGHFSSRYKDLLPFNQEARSVFASTNLALEGLTFDI